MSQETEQNLKFAPEVEKSIFFYFFFFKWKALKTYSTFMGVGSKNFKF